MVPKRVPNEWDSDEPESSKRQLSDLIGRDVTFEEVRSFFEPVFRKTVREVVETLLHVSSPSQSHGEIQRDWMLRFVNQPPPKLFTGNRVEDKDGALLQVEIVDVFSKNVVLTGPLSSLKLEIVVLPGDFDADQQNDLGDKYFDSRVVHAREGKKPLIIGEVRTFLNNGVGLISNVCFTDNSRWTKTAKFRLGVRVLQGYRVREAVSAAFKVKDRRGEACMKHSCPSLMDPIWRLKMIRRNGKYHQRLESIGIETVGDFLQQLKATPSTLKETLKCGSSNKTWNTIVEHALSHKKEPYEVRQVSQKVVCSINHNFPDGVPIPRTYLHDYQLQQVADELEGYTSYNDTHQVPVDVAPTYRSGNLQSELFTQTGLTLPYLDIRDINPGLQGHKFLPCVPTSSNYHEMGNQMDEVPFPNAAPSELHQSLWTGMSDEEFPLWFINDPSEMLVQANHHIPGNHIIHTKEPNWYPCSPLLWRQLSASFSTAISDADMGLLSSLGPNNATPRTAWCKLRAAVIWRILIRQMQILRANNKAVVM